MGVYSIDSFRIIIILPNLMPFDGTNPHSIVVLDNASVHHVDGVADLIQGVGALVMYTLWCEIGSVMQTRIVQRVETWGGVVPNCNI